jgi:hypothetical protein
MRSYALFSIPKITLSTSDQLLLVFLGLFAGRLADIVCRLRAVLIAPSADRL